jgi:hypothetical protein
VRCRCIGQPIECRLEAQLSYVCVLDMKSGGKWPPECQAQSQHGCHPRDSRLLDDVVGGAERTSKSAGPTPYKARPSKPVPRIRISSRSGKTPTPTAPRCFEFLQMTPKPRLSEFGYSSGPGLSGSNPLAPTIFPGSNLDTGFCLSGPKPLGAVHPARSWRVLRLRRSRDRISSEDSARIPAWF